MWHSHVPADMRLLHNVFGNGPELAPNPVTLSDACDPLLSAAFCTPLKRTTWKLLLCSPVSTRAWWVDHKRAALPTFSVCHLAGMFCNQSDVDLIKMLLHKSCSKIKKWSTGRILESATQEKSETKLPPNSSVYSQRLWGHGIGSEPLLSKCSKSTVIHPGGGAVYSERPHVGLHHGAHLQKAAED